MDELRRLYFEPTSFCNLSCEMCFRNTWFDESYCDLPLDVYKNVLKNLPSSVETIFFGGMGEPLFHIDILEMVELASKKVNAVELLTNGMLLDEKMSLALIDAGLTMLWVSLDSFEPQADINGGHGHFEEVEKNIQKFNEIRWQKERRIKLGIAFVASKSNVLQLTQLSSFVAKHDIDEVNISNTYPSDKDAEKEVLFSRSLNFGIAADKMQKHRAVVKVPYMDWNIGGVSQGMQKMMISPYFTVFLGDSPMVRRTNYCRFVDEGMAFIRSDGAVSPCMALLHNGTTCLEGTPRRIMHYSFGNVIRTELGDIWNSEEYSSFRERVRAFNFSPCIICGHCDYVLSNAEDCHGNSAPTCGACLWAEGFLSCP